MSSACEVCPMYGGAAKQGELLEVCGDPPQQCNEYREQLIRQALAWSRLRSVAELSRGGSLDMRSLQPGDVCRLIVSSEGEPYGYDPTYLDLVIGAADEQGRILATVQEDYYGEEIETGEEEVMPMQTGEQVLLWGATDDGETVSTGLLHVGRDYLITRSEVDNYRPVQTGKLQEILIVDPAGVQITLWDTNPNIFRPRPASIQVG